MALELAPDVVIAERFKLNRLIGRGGMGSVWHATHLGLDIPCAVKFIEGEISGKSEAHMRFEREAKAAAQLRSPHVVQILDHGVFDGTPYIAMELLDGEDLGVRVGRMGRMAPNDVALILVQVCRALSKAHAAGIVHRDLKPDNIFLVRDDDREIAKVLDFGIAKAGGNTIEGSATKTGSMLGTPYYMSPEQAQGTRDVDHRSDLWSLAVIAYQCITGHLPFESEALGDLLVKIIVSPIPVPSEVCRDLPPRFDAWWAKAASREPAGRFQTAREFAESLTLACGVTYMTDGEGNTGVFRPNFGSLTGEPSSGSPVVLAGGGPASAPSGANRVVVNTVAGQGPGGADGRMRTLIDTGNGAPALARTFLGDPPAAPVSAGRPKPIALLVGLAAAVLVVLSVGAFMFTRGGNGNLDKTATATATVAATPPATPATPPPAETPVPSPAKAFPGGAATLVAAAATPSSEGVAPAPGAAGGPSASDRPSKNDSPGKSRSKRDRSPTSASPSAATPAPAAAEPKANSNDLGF